MFDKLISTNQYLIDTIPQQTSREIIPVVISELQTHGRGRRFHNWYSNLGGSLTFSLLWTINSGFKHLSGLSLLIALCVVRVLIRLTKADFRIKWPNDVLFNHQKIAGILIECKTNFDHTLSVIIGVGINIKLPLNFYTHIDYPATDLYQITGLRYNRNELLALILVEIYHQLKVFEIHGFSAFREEWLQFHCFQNQPVTLHLPNKKIVEGKVIDVSNEGELILQNEFGLQSFTIGDISLRSKFS